MLCDNIFSGGDDFPRAITSLQIGAIIFALHVKEPQRYGVAQFTSQGKVFLLEEKPAKRKSNFDSPVAYIYNRQVLDITKSIKPPARNELEITDVNLEYLRCNLLGMNCLSCSFIAFEQFQAVVQAIPNYEYRDYLNFVADEFAECN